MARRGRLILIVDPDLDFVEDTRLLLNGERLLTARSLEEAEEIAVGGRVDAAVLGPSFGNEAGVRAATALLAADPTIHLVLAANVVTNRVLLAALQTGFADVVDTPLTVRKLATSLRPRAQSQSAAPLLDVIVEVAPAQPVAVPVTSAVAPPAAIAAPVIAPAPAVAPAPMPLPTPMPVPASLAEPPVIVVPLAPQQAPSPEPVSPMPIAAAPALTPAPEPALGPVGTPPLMAPTATSPSLEALQVAAAPGGLVATPPIPPVSIPPIPPSAPPVPSPVEPLPPPFPPPPQAAPPRLDAEPEPADLPDPLDALEPTELPERREPVVAYRPTEAATRVASDVDEPGDSPSGQGRMIMVIAGKGGSGKSVTATNLALALTFAVGEDAVAIVDADLQFGDVALLLQMDPVRSLTEVARQVDDLSEARLDALLMRHESGLRVLPAPLQPAAADSVSPKAVVQVVEKMLRLYRYVVVDTGGVLDDILLTLLDHADDVVVVVDMDLPSVKNAKVVLDILRSGGYPMERLCLVVNRINSKARLDLVELERSLGLRTAAAIPSDRLVPQSVNEGIPVVALSPRSRVARAFTGLAKLFLPGGSHKGS